VTLVHTIVIKHSYQISHYVCVTQLLNIANFSNVNVYNRVIHLSHNVIGSFIRRPPSCQTKYTKSI